MDVHVLQIGQPLYLHVIHIYWSTAYLNVYWIICSLGKKRIIFVHKLVCNLLLCSLDNKGVKLDSKVSKHIHVYHTVIYEKRACSQRNESRSESRFGTWFGPFPDLKAWFYPLWMQSSFKSGFWNAFLNAKKEALWIVIRVESLILRACERKAFSERDSCVRIMEMRTEAMHGSISADCAVGTKYYLAVRRSCSRLGRRLQCLWTHIHVVQITIPITKRRSKTAFETWFAPLWTGPVLIQHKITIWFHCQN